MQEDRLDYDAFFDVAIHRYTRAQALEDGVLVDVSELAREAGFKVPVALTGGAWDAAVAWTNADTSRQVAQDEPGRLWDVLWAAYVSARGSPNSSRIAFQLCVVPRDGSSTHPRLMTLHLQIGAGDGGEPVITVLMQHED